MLTEKELNNIFNTKVKLLLDREARLKKTVKGLERTLFDMIIKEVLSKLETEGGVITRNKKNLKITTAVQSIFNKFNKDFNSAAVSTFVDDLEDGLTLANTYFSGFTTRTKFNALKTKNKAIVLARLGVNKKGNLIKNGFLEGFLSDSSVKNKVAQATARNISSGNSISVFQKELRTIIKGGTGSTGGALESHYQTFAYDAYQEVDNTYSELIATDLELEAFRYSGGLIETSRQFCCERNGLIFTRKEAQTWRTLEFNGKPKSGYNPLTMRGGFGCRHSLQWLPSEMAANRRQDLEVRNGKLRKKVGVPRQKVNTCLPKKKVKKRR